jgi:hypothetical protein
VLKLLHRSNSFYLTSAVLRGASAGVAAVAPAKGIVLRGAGWLFGWRCGRFACVVLAAFAALSTLASTRWHGAGVGGALHAKRCVGVVVLRKSRRLM